MVLYSLANGFFFRKWVDDTVGYCILDPCCSLCISYICHACVVEAMCGS
jgi:hypothetical protein